jgi:plasmid stabilization system protein ParE
MEQLYEVRISGEASADLLAIHEYVRQDSPQNADELPARLFAAIDNLKIFPHRYSIYRKTRKPKLIIRSMVVSSFIVYYYVMDADRVVRILTVRRGTRRQPRRFN